MANSDKNIVITPNIGSALDPKIVFSGASGSVGPQNITLQVYPTNSGTLSFEGSAGQLFSITNSMTGTIFSVNDVSGVPSIEVLDTGLVKLAQYSGNVLLGSGTDNGTNKLQVTGTASVVASGGSTTTPNIALILDYESATTSLAGGGTAIEFRGKSSGGNIANYSQARIRSVSYDSNNSHGIAFDYKPNAGTSLTEGFRLTNAGDLNLAGHIQTNSAGVKWDQSGVRSWSMYPASGNLDIVAGDTSGNLRFNSNIVLHAGNYTSYRPPLLAPINVTSTSVSNWNPQSLTYQAWGQAFVNSNISSDSGDIVYWLRASQYGAGGTEVCVIIDGDYFAGGGANKVLHAGNYGSYALPLSGGTMTGPVSIDGGTANAATDATLKVSATNNNDWGIIVDKYNSSATEYGVDIRVGSLANYAFRIQGNNSETFRITGAGSALATAFYDISDTNYFLDPASNSNLNTLTALGALSAVGTGVQNSGGAYGLRNVMPGGGSFIYSASTGTGAIRITLPASLSPMLKFTVKVYTYDNLSFDIHCGGHTSGGTWYNTFAYMATQNRQALNVRFSYGNSQLYVDIGELNSTWSYPQVFITDVQVGYADTAAGNWDNGWSISLNTSSHNNINATHVVFPSPTSGANINPVYGTIYYDSNDTAYYADPNGLSAFNRLRTYGGDSSSPTQIIQAAIYPMLDFTSDNTNANNRNWRLAGVYTSYGLFQILSSTSANGTPTTPRLGINGSGYVGIGEAAASTGNWLQIGSIGATGYGGNHIAIGNGTQAFAQYLNGATSMDFYTTSGYFNFDKYIQASGSMRAPIFYDSDDTAYYVDPNVTSRFVSHIIGGHSGTAYNTASTGRLYIGTNADNNYSIYTAMENVGGNYTKLILDWHTGIKIGAYSNYGGTRFYNDAVTSGGTKIFSVGEGDNNVRAYGDIRSPVFYDLDNTAYYVDPYAGGFNLFVSDVNGVITGTASSSGLIIENNATSGPKLSLRSTAASGKDLWLISNNTSNADGAGRLQFWNATNSYTFATWGTTGSDNHLIYGSYTQMSGSARAPIFYDSGDTAYYVDAASTSELNRINTVRANNWLYLNNNYGHSVVGLYSASRLQGVFAMGDAYKLAADGLGVGDLYGLAWSHPNAGTLGGANNLADHGLLLLQAGVFKGAWGGGSFRTPSDVRGTLFYDYSDTAFYLDPAATGTSLNVAGAIIAAGNITAFSDKRVKKDIQPILDPIEKVKLLNGVTFSRTDLEDKDTRYAGLIAQDVEDALPEAVFEDTLKRVDYNAVIGLLVEAVKKQQEEIDQLKALINKQ